MSSHNPTHADLNWTQRVRQETAMEENWKKNWGFMDASNGERDKGSLKHLSSDELFEEATKLSPTYDYVTTMKKERTLNQSRSIAEKPPKRTQTPSPVASLPGSNVSARSSSIAGVQMQPLMSTRQWDNTTDRYARRNPASLDVGSAVAMQRKHIHAVGRSLELPGVDPAAKYAYPQTRSQEVGWRAYNTLEIFGVAQHGKQATRWNDR